MELKIHTTDNGDRTMDTLDGDIVVRINSQEEWRKAIQSVGDKIISSVLYPTDPLFNLDGPNLRTLSHAHERFYNLTDKIVSTYCLAAENLSEGIRARLETKEKVLVYLPLRGALPIWETIKNRMHPDEIKKYHEYHAVTSSFVMYPELLGIRSRKGKNASGRYANILELKRLNQWCLKQLRFDSLLYVDEIISGGMMWGHVKEMIEMGIRNTVPITVVGMADSFGSRFKRDGQLKQAAKRGDIDFVYEGCHTLISEDQKFAMGIHYVDNKFGPNVVPVMDENLQWYSDKTEFDRQIKRKR